MVDADPLAALVQDPAYLETKGGLQQDPSQNPGQVPDWLDETIIPIPEIEEFKVQLREMRMR